MADARDVARCLIAVGFDPAAPDDSVMLCPLRLQKLLYYCQGWSLALLGRPLFRQPIEAWENGPVVRDVYFQFAGRRDGIRPEEAGDLASPLSPTEEALVRTVWQQYAHCRPGELVDMTHREPAWREARGDLPAEAKSSAHLSLDTMADYFRDQARAQAAAGRPVSLPAIDLADDWRAEEEWEQAGRPTISGAELFKSLLSRID